MNKIKLLLISLVFLTACNSNLELKNLKTDTHKFVNDTRVFISPVDYGEYRRTISYHGFEEMSKHWKLKVMSSRSTIETLDKTYSKIGLKRKLQGELIEKMEVVHPAGYEGFYVNYKEPKTKSIIHLLILHIEDEVIMVKGTYAEYAPEVINNMVRRSVQGIYIASKKDAEKEQFIFDTVPNKDNNIYQFLANGFKFAGELNSYYYFSRDGEYPTNSPDSSWIAFKPIWNASKSQYRDKVFQNLLGSDYEVTKTEEQGRNDIAWLAKNSANTKMAIAGIVWGNNINVIKGSFINNFEENSETLIKMAMKIRMK